MNKEESIKKILALVKAEDLTDEVDRSNIVNPKTMFALKYYDKFDISSVDGTISFNNTVGSYVYAWALWKEYSKGKGKASIEKYGKDIESLEYFKEQLEDVYESMTELGIENEEEEKAFLSAVSYDSKIAWQNLGMLGECYVYLDLAKNIGEEIKGKGSNEDDKGSLGDDED